jgi:hypothetical protein
MKLNISVSLLEKPIRIPIVSIDLLTLTKETYNASVSTTLQDGLVLVEESQV